MTEDIIHTLTTFLRTPSEKPKLIVIYGPTGCGKTGMSIEIARYIETLSHSTKPTYQPFIISADSRQIYRGMDIGTGKIQKEEMQGIPHFMLDIIEPTEQFSVVDFRERVEQLDMWKRWQDTLSIPLPESTNISNFQLPIPIICGGTGLYVDSLVFERNYPSIPADWELRAELEDFRLKNGNEALWNRLHELDPIYANTLHPNDRHYIIRGIEVYTKSGRSKMEIQDTPTLRYDTLWLTPYDGDREKLYTHINARVEKMFDTGLIDEVRYILDNLSRQLLQNCNNGHCPGLATIGYAEVVEYIEGHISLDACKSLVKQHNRNYAKRQITWNKKYGGSI